MCRISITIFSISPRLGTIRTVPTQPLEYRRNTRHCLVAVTLRQLANTHQHYLAYHPKLRHYQPYNIQPCPTYHNAGIRSLPRPGPRSVHGRRGGATRPGAGAGAGGAGAGIHRRRRSGNGREAGDSGESAEQRDGRIFPDYLPITATRCV